MLLLFYGFAVCFSACGLPRYSCQYESPKGLALSDGRWLVVPVETNLSLGHKERLSLLLAEKFRSMCGDSVDFLGEVTLNYLSPVKFATELRPEVLDVLRRTTTYDYVVTARVSLLRNDIGSIVVPAPSAYQKNEAEALILVYAVDSGRRVYCQRVTAVVAVDRDDSEMSLVASGRKLAYKALRKALRRLKSESVLP